MDVQVIQNLAKNIRIDVLNMTFRAGINGGHLGGCLSCADILAVLYGSVLKNDPNQTGSDERDRFLLSKGHVAMAHYAVLAEVGFIRRDELDTFEQDDTQLSTHEVMCIDKGIEISSGSLGYGLSIGVGVALAAKKKKKKYKTYILLGDGECNEGSVWEAAMAAARYRLNNITAIVDVNQQSLDGYTKDIMPVFDMENVFRSFGWKTVLIDGHDIVQIYNALHVEHGEKPMAVIAMTQKGKGIASIENRLGWHHAHISEEQYRKFLGELEAM